MAPGVVFMRSATTSRSLTSRRAPARLHTPAAPISLPFAHSLPSRTSIKRFSSDTGAENDDQLVNDRGEIMQGRQEMKTSPMSEGKKAQTPEQGGAPEGDQAVADQAYQTKRADNRDVMSPESGEKAVGSEGQSAGEVVQQEEAQQEDRAPLQD